MRGRADLRRNRDASSAARKQFVRTKVWRDESMRTVDAIFAIRLRTESVLRPTEPDRRAARPDELTLFFCMSRDAWALTQ
jgi:hypothetical protein